MAAAAAPATTAAVDYGKLKVTELKALLKDRKIPLTGLKLKQNYIDKLLEVDAANIAGPTAAPLPSPNEAPRQEFSASTASVTPSTFQHPENTLSMQTDAQNQTLPRRQLVSDILQSPEQPTLNGEPPDSEPKANENALVVDNGDDQALAKAPGTMSPPALPSTNQPDNGEVGSIVETSQKPLFMATQTQSSTSMHQSRGEGGASIEQFPARHLASRSPSGSMLSQEVTGVEMAEDEKKRKRRSNSPVPETQEVAQKRARVEEETRSIDNDDRQTARHGDMSQATAETDTVLTGIDTSREGTSRSSPVRVGAASVEQTGVDNALESKKWRSRSPSDTSNPWPRPEQEPGPPGQGDKERLERRPSIERSPSTKRADDRLPPNGDSESHNHDRASLLPHGQTGSPERAQSPVSPSQKVSTNNDRPIAPAVHPATRSLYISNFKRPLNLPSLRNHISSLAASPTQPAQSRDGEVISDFYIDSIRTHAFVSFTSVSAASRVRAALHESRFPDEKTREPLWVDFIPDDRLHRWVDIEQDVAGDGRPGRRWQVVYRNTTDDTVEADLQEVGGGGAGGGTGGKAVSGRAEPSFDRGSYRSGIAAEQNGSDMTAMSTRVAPSVHPDRSKLVPRHNPHPRSPHATETADFASERPRLPPPSSSSPHRPAIDLQPSTGFGALDDLFSSTAGSKPKIYYKPVTSPQIIQERQDRLRRQMRNIGRAQSGDPGMKRYSFETVRDRRGEWIDWIDKGPEFGFRRGGGGRQGKGREGKGERLGGEGGSRYYAGGRSGDDRGGRSGRNGRGGGSRGDSWRSEPRPPPPSLPQQHPARSSRW